MKSTICAALLAALGGCAIKPDSGPVGWWHHMEGGPIAAERPPPPGQSAPYPKLGSVPPEPTPVNPATRAKTYAALTADRADATYEATSEPLRAAAPKDEAGFFAPAPAATPNPDAAGAALQAATPTGQPATANQPTPAARSATPAATPPVLTSIVDTPIPDITPDPTPAPTVPDFPPPQPRVAGITIPVTIPHLPPKAPPPPAPSNVLTAAAAAPVSIAFESGSAILTLADQGALRALAARRGAHSVQLIGFGEAGQEDAESQYLGVTLALRRARAMADALIGDGVPATALRIAGNAPGQGAAARLIDRDTPSPLIE